MSLSRVRAGIAIVAAIAVAGLVAGCGSFDSKVSGEHLIKNYVGKYGKGRVTLKSVSCPSDVKQKTGSSYACKVTLKNVQSGQQANGTITIHIVSGNKVEIFGSQDVHVS
jgi:phosphoheptose isomerase